MDIYPREIKNYVCIKHVHECSLQLYSYLLKIRNNSEVFPWRTVELAGRSIIQGQGLNVFVAPNVYVKTLTLNGMARGGVLEGVRIRADSEGSVAYLWVGVDTRACIATQSFRITHPRACTHQESASLAGCVYVKPWPGLCPPICKVLPWEKLAKVFLYDFLQLYVDVQLSQSKKLI